MYGCYRGNDYVDLMITRTFPEISNEPKILFDQDSYRKQNNQSHYFNAGIDYYANQQTTVGMSMRGNIGEKTENGTLSSLFYTLASPSDSTILSHTDNRQNSKNINSTLYLQHKIDSLGKEISASANGLYYAIDETQVHHDMISTTSGASAGSGSHALKNGTIKEGCLRTWVNNDGKEITTQFFFEGDSVASIESFRTNQPSLYSIESIEPCKLRTISQHDFQAALEEIPELKKKMEEHLFRRFFQSQQFFYSFLKNKPQQRYEELIKLHPHIIQRVPQHYIASYLGITPVSLSRIRKRQ